MTQIELYHGWASSTMAIPWSVCLGPHSDFPNSSMMALHHDPRISPSPLLAHGLNSPSPCAATKSPATTRLRSIMSPKLSFGSWPSFLSTPITYLAPSIINHHPMQTRAKSGIVKPKTCCHLFPLLMKLNLLCFTIASKKTHMGCCMTKEFNALFTNDTRELTPPFLGIGSCEWVYKIHLMEILRGTRHY